MTNTTYLASVPSSGADEPVKRAPSLSTMKLAELQGLAGSLGLTGTAKMRKGDLVTAIRGRQSGASSQADSKSADSTPVAAAPSTAAADSTPVAAAPSTAAQAVPAAQAEPAAAVRPVRTSRRAQRPVGVQPADEIATPVVADQAGPVVAPRDPAREDNAEDDGRPPRRGDRQNDRQQGGRHNNRQNDNRQQGQNDNRQQGQNDNRQQIGRAHV